jgi:hypothetical protein
VSVGDLVRVRQTSAATFATTTTATLTVSDFTAAFAVTTKSVADVTAVPSFAADARVLVLLACRKGSLEHSTGSGKSGAEPEDDDDACVSQRVASLDGYLASLGVDHAIVTTTDAFKVAFRSGRYDTYWLSGGGDKLHDTLADELREAGFRGETVIADGVHDERNGELDDVFGVKFRGKSSAQDTVTVTSARLPAGSFATAGARPDRVDLTTGAVLATFAAGAPAMASNTYGGGAGLLFAFDLVGTIQAQPTSPLLKSVLGQSLEIVAPHPPAAYTGGAYVPFAIVLGNAEPVPVNLAVTISPPSGFILVSSEPPATPSGATFAWSIAIAPGASKSIEGALRVPQASGTYVTPVSVSQSYAGSTVAVGTYELKVVVKGADTEMAATIAALQALALTAENDRSARDEAVKKLQEAQKAVATASWEDAIGKLLEAIEKLDGVAGANVSAQRTAIDRLLQEIERTWWSGLPACPVASGSCRAP